VGPVMRGRVFLKTDKPGSEGMVTDFEQTGVLQLLLVIRLRAPTDPPPVKPASGGRTSLRPVIHDISGQPPGFR